MLEADNINIEQALKEQEEIAVCTSGTSMYPMLRNRRDMVLITRVNRPLVKNDVVLYRLSSGKLVLHRIIKVTSESFIIRGDNLYKKEIVRCSDVFGVLKGFYRNGKFCDCAVSKGYKIYIFYIKASYPVRYLIFGVIKSFLRRLKHFIIGKTDKK